MIFNGTEVNANEFTSVASFFRMQKSNRSPTFYTHICMAIILNHRFALTAAHCGSLIDQQNLSGLFLAAGTDHDLTKIYSNSIYHRKVLKIIINPKYDIIENIPVNDLALIETDPFILGSSLAIYATCIIDKETEDLNYFVTAGYGDTESKYEKIKRLRFLESTLESSSKFKMRWTELKYDRFGCYMPNTICAYSYSSSVCSGDSGGGLWSVQKDRLILVGITSYGDLKKFGNLSIICGAGVNLRFASIYPHLDWISKYIKKDQLCRS